jgi:hypothetical protein
MIILGKPTLIKKRKRKKEKKGGKTLIVVQNLVLKSRLGGP